MPEVKTPLLSIIVISHNQREDLSRCLDSILAQDIPFVYEIIVSDDASKDGTWELILEYEQQFPGIIKGFQCDSNDCNPANNSQRSGWNRCNAYPHARGTYIAHVDGDDYFTEGTHVLQHQVEVLETHHDCSLCLANVFIEDGIHPTKENLWIKRGTYKDGDIIEAGEFIRSHRFILNQAFIQRRNPDVNPVALYGRRYVDSVITFHHLQFGDIVCVDDIGYIYRWHQNSIASSMSQTKDTMVTWCLGLYIPALIPRWRNEFYASDTRCINDVITLARSGYRLSDNNLASLSDLNIYIYNTFNRRLRYSDILRLKISSFYVRHIVGTHRCTSQFSLSIMHRLLCKECQHSF